jgi:ubiquinone biosynthesis protein UbiJ
MSAINFDAMLSRPFSSFVNHLLASAEWARANLTAHAGKVAVFEISPMHVAVVVDAEGMLRPAEAGAVPSVTIRLTPATALQFVAEREAAWRNADIEGDTDFAAALSRIAANIDWDIEEDLSRLFGDIAAHRLAAAGRAAAAWPKQGAESIATGLAEYLTEEKHLLVTPLQATEFLAEVDELRDDVERLDKRIERLQRRTDGA